MATPPVSLRNMKMGSIPDQMEPILGRSARTRPITFSS